MFVFLLPYALGGICGPSLQSLLSKSIPANQQGELQGALTSLVSVTSIIGPPVMTNLFYSFTQEDAPLPFAGAPFLVAALLMLMSTGFVYLSFKKQRSK